MNKESYSSGMVVSKSTSEVFSAISQVQLWWTENLQGNTHELHDEFTVTFGETYIRLRVVEREDPLKVVWLVTDCHKHFLSNKKEWVDTRICFELTDGGKGETKLIFTHFGLSAPLECYEICCDAWNGYLQGSLKSLISTGTGMPDKKM